MSDHVPVSITGLTSHADFVFDSVSVSEEVHAALQSAVGFHCLVEEWHDCEELKPKPKEMWTRVAKKGGSNKASHGVVCGREQTPLYEVWKKQQTYEHAMEV